MVGRSLYLDFNTSTSTFDTDYYYDRPEITEDDTSSTANIARTDNEEATINGDKADDVQYIAGLPLLALIIGLTLAAFLLMIDSTILVTVSHVTFQDSNPLV